MLGDEGFEEVTYAVRHRSPASLALLNGGIAAFQSSGKDLLRCYLGLMECHPAIRANGKFPQLRARPRGAVEHHKHLAALRRDLDPKTRASLIPIDAVLGRRRERINDALGQLRAGHRAVPSLLPRTQIGSIAWVISGPTVTLHPHQSKRNQYIVYL